MESTAKESMSAATEVPVLIVGGGACGLALSCFLSNYGVKHVLLERRLETSKLPKAHYLNQRTMETFRQHAMVDEILQKACPPKYMSRVAWMTSLGGSEPMDRQVIHTLPCHGGEAKSAEAEAYRLVIYQDFYCSSLLIADLQARCTIAISQSPTNATRTDLTTTGRK